MGVSWWLTAISTLITGLCYGSNKYFQWKRYKLHPRIAYYSEWLAYHFRSLMILLLVRSFIVEWSIIPSESLMPTLLATDRVITDKAAYGIRLPVTGHLLIPFDYPKRGDIVVFRSPVALGNSLMSRIIGLPGDRVQYCDHKLIINENPVIQREIGVVSSSKDTNATKISLCEENLAGHRYQVYKQVTVNTSLQGSQNVDCAIDVVVPKGHYFVIGDHRDNSIDSRTWGFLPDHCLLGKVKRICLSYNKPAVWWQPHHWLRWSRLGVKVK